MGIPAHSVIKSKRVTPYMVSAKYFNEGVKSLDSPHIGFLVRETSDKIIVFGEGVDIYDILKSATRFAAASALKSPP